VAENSKHSLRQHEPDIQYGADRERRTKVGRRVVMVVSMMMPVVVAMMVMIGMRRYRPCRCAIGGMVVAMRVIMIVIMRVVMRAHGRQLILNRRAVQRPGVRAREAFNGVTSGAWLG
jgi:hypothetical protein